MLRPILKNNRSLLTVLSEEFRIETLIFNALFTVRLSGEFPCQYRQK